MRSKRNSNLVEEEAEEEKEEEEEEEEGEGEGEEEEEEEEAEAGELGVSSIVFAAVSIQRIKFQTSGSVFSSICFNIPTISAVFEASHCPFGAVSSRANNRPVYRRIVSLAFLFPIYIYILFPLASRCSSVSFPNEDLL